MTSGLLDCEPYVVYSSVEKIFHPKYSYGTVKVRFNYGILLVLVRKRFYVPYCVRDSSIRTRSTLLIPIEV